MDFQTTFMDVLKARFTEVAGARQFGGVNSPSQAPYYLARIEDNLVMPMSEQHLAEYSQGTGKELEGKMKSLRSSSAMTFNLLGNGPVRVKGDDAMPAGTYDVQFEHQLPTLAGNPTPANLDAKLTALDGSCAVYCEMKLAEWVFHKASGLRSPYLDAGNYLVPASCAAVFVNVLERLTTDEENDDGRLKPKLERYDALQMAKHLLAIYTECVRIADAGGGLPPRIALVNCVWEMRHPERLGKYEPKYRALEDAEHGQFAQFAKAIEPAASLFADLGIALALRYYSFAQFRNQLDLAFGHDAALERYVI